ncbi:RNA-processing protein [Candidatus Micrarchaeota archaeon]|nr:RNA-processing protein [Candidatus Micrarchaeota archaeon]
MELVKIPVDRVAVLIGSRGRVKRGIERKFKVKLVVGEDGDVEIDSPAGDAYTEWRVKDVVKAVGRGFAPEKAFKLFSEDYYFKLVDLGDLFNSDKDVQRYKGRVIGEHGKARGNIEALSGADVCVYGDTIGFIGLLEEVNLAFEAVQALLQGASHSRVFRLLERGRRKMKEEQADLWEKRIS